MVKEILFHEAADIVMLEETKQEICDTRSVCSVWLLRTRSGLPLPAWGHQVGIDNLGLKQA